MLEQASIKLVALIFVLIYYLDLVSQTICIVKSPVSIETAPFKILRMM